MFFILCISFILKAQNNDTCNKPGGGMNKMNNRIKCQVEECIYNGDGLCGAESIEVKSSGKSMRVGTSEGTRCSTFKYKNIK